MILTWSSDGLRTYQVNSNLDLKLLKHDVFTVKNNIKSISFSNNKCYSYLDEKQVYIVDLSTLEVKINIPIDSASRVLLSRCGKYAFVYKSCVQNKDNTSKLPNIFIYNVEDGSLLKEYYSQKSDGWQPQWNRDSSMCAILVKGEVHFYENNKFENKPFARLSVRGICHFSMSNSIKTTVAIYIPGHKNQPSMVQIYQINGESFTLVANKSFYKADSVCLLWNDKGTDLLILTSIKVSNENYYGDQSLYYMSSSHSGNSAIVTLPRKGPIYQVAWKPNHQLGSNSNRKIKDDLFAVCYGFTPASITLFGLDCEPWLELGSGSWNQFHFNPFGNLLLLAGLGNLSGDMCVWDLEAPDKLSEFKTTDITSISWLPDGEHLALATTTPRLRVNNGFGIWHYGGQRLFYEAVTRRSVPRPATMDLPAAIDHELYQVYVVVYSNELGPIPKPRKFDSAKSNLTAHETSSVYVPPALRNLSAVSKQSLSVTRRDDSFKSGYEPVSNAKSLSNNLSNSKSTKSSKSKPPLNITSDSNQAPIASDLKNQKKINQMHKKLIQIEQLKNDQAAGKQLAFNQLDKISTESQLRAEIDRLVLS